MKKLATIFQRPGSKNYLARYRDFDGHRLIRSTGSADPDAAQEIADRMALTAQVKGESGVEGQLADESRRTIDEHLADYEAKMQAAGRTGEHVADTLRLIRATCELAKIKTAGDISADRINRAAVQLGKVGLPSKRKGVKQKPFSTRTVHSYLTAIKGFSKWLAENGKLARDPLAGVKKPNPELNRKIERRMLLPDEWHWLKTTTLVESLGSRGIPAAERILLYATAIQTGLRSAELRSLTRARLFLTGQQPYITCKARSTKNRQDARQYVQPELAAELRNHIKLKAPTAPIFAMPHETGLAAMLRDDLAAARKAWLKAAPDADERLRREQSDFLAVKNHDGEALDFHSLRHTCGAWLAMSGAHPKAVQAVMRHSTIVLTMDRYAHLFPGQEAETVARLPAMFGAPPVEARATGTNGGGASKAHQNKPNSLHLVASSDSPAESADWSEPTPEALAGKRDCNETALVAANCEAPRQGLEPWTRGLTVRCSTN